MIVREIIIENSAVIILARVRKADGEYLTRAATSSLTCKVFDLDGETPDTAVATPSLVIADTIFDTLQIDSRWAKDGTGFNFSAGLAGTCFPSGGHTYQVEVKVTTTEGDPFYIVAQLGTENIRSE